MTEYLLAAYIAFTVEQVILIKFKIKIDEIRDAD